MSEPAFDPLHVGGCGRSGFSVNHFRISLRCR